MPKVLFYAGTAFCLFLALTSAAESARELQGGSLAFVALQGLHRTESTGRVRGLHLRGSEP